MDDVFGNRLNRKSVFIFAISALAILAGKQVWAGESQIPKSQPFLIVDLDGDGVDRIPLNESAIDFDADGDGLAERMEWIKPDDGFLIVLSREERHGLSNARNSIYAHFLNGSEKVTHYDKSKDSIYNANDYLSLSPEKTYSELGIAIARDQELTGIPNKKGKNKVPCKFKELSFLEKDKMNLLCADGTSYPVYEVRFEYQDTNSIWKSLCDKIEGNPKERQEYLTYCLNAPNTKTQKGN